MVPLKWWACTDANATSYSPCRPRASLILRGVSFPATQKCNEGGRIILAAVRSGDSRKPLKTITAALYCSRLRSTTFRENVTSVFFSSRAVAMLHSHENVLRRLVCLEFPNENVVFEESRTWLIAILFRSIYEWTIFWNCEIWLYFQSRISVRQHCSQSPFSQPARNWMFSRIYNVRFNPWQLGAVRASVVCNIWYAWLKCVSHDGFFAALNTMSRGSLSQAIWKTQVGNFRIYNVLRITCHIIVLLPLRFLYFIIRARRGRVRSIKSRRGFALLRVHFRRRHAIPTPAGNV